MGDRVTNTPNETLASLIDAMQDAEQVESENKVGLNAVIFVDTIL